MLKGDNDKLKQDLSFLIVGLFFAALLWHNKIIDQFLAPMEEARLLGAFVAGLFFSTAFTTMPAVAVITKLGKFGSPATIALLGAMGAVISDSVIYYFIRDKLVGDFFDTLKKPRLKRIQHFLKSKIIRFSLGLISGILIALPLPTDETAFTIMGVSRIKTYTFLLIAFSFNFAAIYLMVRIGTHFIA